MLYFFRTRDPRTSIIPIDVLCSGGNMQKLYAILPYLYTTKPFFVAGTTFRPSGDLEGLTPEESQQLRSVVSSFYLADGKPITEVVYAVLDISGNAAEANEQIRQLRAAHTILTYLVTSDEYDQYEQCAIYLFFPTEIVVGEPKPAVVPGYSVAADWLYSFEITPEKGFTRPCPPLTPSYQKMGPPRSFPALSIQAKSHVWTRGVCSRRRPKSARGKVADSENAFTSYGLYNRSFSRFVSEPEKIVFSGRSLRDLFPST